MSPVDVAKTERITILTSPEFKRFLQDEAQKEGVSVSQLVRQRCEMKSKDDEVLSALVLQVEEATKKAKTSLERGLADAAATLAELREAK